MTVSSVVCADGGVATPFGEKVCRATVAFVMGHDPSIVSISRIDGSIIHLSYRRPSDGTEWSFRCKLAGSRVMHSGVSGRWLDHPLDEVVTYSASDTHINLFLKYPDGSIIDQKSFDISALERARAYS
jgi:hypothetical protein